MKIGIAADHGGYELKGIVALFLKKLGYDLVDYGAFELDAKDDYPDFIIPLAKAIAQKEIERGVAICGSGVGASIAANKVAGVRAALIHDHFSAHQGVEDDDMNLICLGGRVTAFMAAEELITSFLDAKFIGAERHKRRLQKVALLEQFSSNQ
jgi:ribose 5-phosphate isomerase B